MVFKGGTTLNMVFHWLERSLNGVQRWNDLEQGGTTLNNDVQRWNDDAQRWNYIERWCTLFKGGAGTTLKNDGGSRVERPWTMVFKLERPWTMVFQARTTLNDGVQGWNTIVPPLDIIVQDRPPPPSKIFEHHRSTSFHPWKPSFQSSFHSSFHSWRPTYIQLVKCRNPKISMFWVI